MKFQHTNIPITNTLEILGIIPILSLKKYNNALATIKLNINKALYCLNCLKILTFDLKDQNLLRRKLNQNATTYAMALASKYLYVTLSKVSLMNFSAISFAVI